MAKISVNLHLNEADVENIRKQVQNGLNKLAIDASPQSLAALSKKISAEVRPELKVGVDVKSLAGWAKIISKGVGEVPIQVKADLTKLQADVNKIAGKRVNIQVDVTDKTLREVSKTIDHMSDAFEKVSKAKDRFSANVDEKFPKITSHIALANAELSKMAKLLSEIKVNSNIGNVSERAAKVAKDPQANVLAPSRTGGGKTGRTREDIHIDSLNKKLQEQVEKTTKATEQNKKLKDSMDKAGESAKGFGEKLGFSAARFSAYLAPAALIFGLSRGISIASGQVYELSKSLNILGQVMDTNEQKTAKFADSLLKATTKYGESAKEVLSIAELAAKASNKFTNANQVAQVTTLVSKAPLVAGFGTSKETIDGLITTLGQFNKSGDEASAILDRLAEVSKKSAINANEFFESIKTGGATFSEAGGQIEEYIALMSSLAQNTGLAGGAVGAGINALSEKFLRPEEQIVEERVTGKSARTSSGELRPLLDRLKDIAAVTKSMPKGEQADVFNKLFDIREAKYGIPIINDLQKSAGLYDQTLKTIQKDSAGAFNQGAARGVESIANQIDSVGAAFSKTFLQMASDPSIKEFVKDIADMAKGFASALSSATPFLGTILKLSAVLGAGLLYNARGQIGQGFGKFLGTNKRGGGSTSAGVFAVGGPSGDGSLSTSIPVAIPPSVSNIGTSYGSYGGSYQSVEPLIIPPEPKKPGQVTFTTWRRSPITNSSLFDSELERTEPHYGVLRQKHILSHAGSIADKYTSFTAIPQQYNLNPNLGINLGGLDESIQSEEIPYTSSRSSPERLRKALQLRRFRQRRENFVNNYDRVNIAPSQEFGQNYNQYRVGLQRVRSGTSQDELRNFNGSGIDLVRSSEDKIGQYKVEMDKIRTELTTSILARDLINPHSNYIPITAQNTVKYDKLTAIINKNVATLTAMEKEEQNLLQAHRALSTVEKSAALEQKFSISKKGGIQAYGVAGDIDISNVLDPNRNRNTGFGSFLKEGFQGIGSGAKTLGPKVLRGLKTFMKAKFALAAEALGGLKQHAGVLAPFTIAAAGDQYAEYLQGDRSSLEGNNQGDIASDWRESAARNRQNHLIGGAFKGAATGLAFWGMTGNAPLMAMGAAQGAIGGAFLARQEAKDAQRQDLMDLIARGNYQQGLSSTKALVEDYKDNDWIGALKGTNLDENGQVKDNWADSLNKSQAFNDFIEGVSPLSRLRHVGEWKDSAMNWLNNKPNRPSGANEEPTGFGILQQFGSDKKQDLGQKIEDFLKTDQGQVRLSKVRQEFVSRRDKLIGGGANAEDATNQIKAQMTDEAGGADIFQHFINHIAEMGSAGLKAAQATQSFVSTLQTGSKTLEEFTFNLSNRLRDIGVQTGRNVIAGSIGSQFTAGIMGKGDFYQIPGEISQNITEQINSEIRNPKNIPTNILPGRDTNKFIINKNAGQFLSDDELNTSADIATLQGMMTGAGLELLRRTAGKDIETNKAASGQDLSKLIFGDGSKNKGILDKFTNQQLPGINEAGKTAYKQWVLTQKEQIEKNPGSYVVDPTTSARSILKSTYDAGSIKDILDSKIANVNSETIAQKIASERLGLSIQGRTEISTATTQNILGRITQQSTLGANPEQTLATLGRFSTGYQGNALAEASGNLNASRARYSSFQNLSDKEKITKTPQINAAFAELKKNQDLYNMALGKSNEELNKNQLALENLSKVISNFQNAAKNIGGSDFQETSNAKIQFGIFNSASGRARKFLEDAGVANSSQLNKLSPAQLQQLQSLVPSNSSFEIGAEKSAAGKFGGFSYAGSKTGAKVGDIVDIFDILRGLKTAGGQGLQGSKDFIDALNKRETAANNENKIRADQLNATQSFQTSMEKAFGESSPFNLLFKKNLPVTIAGIGSGKAPISNVITPEKSFSVDNITPNIGSFASGLGKASSLLGTGISEFFKSDKTYDIMDRVRVASENAPMTPEAGRPYNSKKEKDELEDREDTALFSYRQFYHPDNKPMDGETQQQEKERYGDYFVHNTDKALEEATGNKEIHIKVDSNLNITGFEGVGRNEATKAIVVGVLKHFADGLHDNPVEVGLKDKLMQSIKLVSSSKETPLVNPGFVSPSMRN